MGLTSSPRVGPICGPLARVPAKAFNFVGGGQFVRSNSSVANFGTSDFTIDFWMQTSAISEEIVNKRPVCNLSDTVDSFEVRVANGGQIVFELLRDGDNSNSILM